MQGVRKAQAGRQEKEVFYPCVVSLAFSSKSKRARLGSFWLRCSPTSTDVVLIRRVLPCTATFPQVTLLSASKWKRMQSTKRRSGRMSSLKRLGSLVLYSRAADRDTTFAS